MSAPITPQGWLQAEPPSCVPQNAPTAQPGAAFHGHPVLPEAESHPGSHHSQEHSRTEHSSTPAGFRGKHQEYQAIGGIHTAPSLWLRSGLIPCSARGLLCEKQGLFFRPLPQPTGSSLSIIHPTEEILIPRLILHSESKPLTSLSSLPVSRGEPVRAHGSHPRRAG